MKNNSRFAVLAISSMFVLASCGGGSSASSSSTKTDSSSTTTTSSQPASSSSSSGPISYNNVNTPIVVWAPAEEEAVIKDVVDAYNANQTVETSKFNYKFTAVSESDGGTTLATDPQVTNYPSLVACADDHINNLVNKKIINPITGNLLNTIKANDSEFAVTCFTNNDNLYAFPITSDNGYFLWYDSTTISDTQAESLETILATAKAAGKKVLMDVPNGWYVNSFFMAPDACGKDSLKWKQTTDEDGVAHISYDIGWDGEVGVKVATYIASVLQPYYADGTLLTGGDAIIQSGFTDGSMVACVSGLWNEKVLSKIIPDSLRAAKLPTYTMDSKAYQMGSFSGSKGYVVNAFASAGEQKAAYYLGNLLTQKAAQLVRFEKRASIPCNTAALADKSYTDAVSIGAKALNAQSAYASIQSSSAEGRYWDVGKAIGQALCDGDFGELGTDWTTFLKANCEGLRKAN